MWICTWPQVPGFPRAPSFSQLLGHHQNLWKHKRSQWVDCQCWNLANQETKESFLFLQSVSSEPLSSKLRIRSTRGHLITSTTGVKGKSMPLAEQIYAWPGQLMLCPEPGKGVVAQGKALGLISLPNWGLDWEASLGRTLHQSWNTYTSN